MDTYQLGPWPEPDRASATRRIPGTAWAYVIVAVLVAALWLVAGRAPWPMSLIGTFRPFEIVFGVATVLLGAALFIRHPHAWSAHRPVAVATVLFAVAELIRAATPIVAVLGATPDQLGLGLNGGYVSWAIGLAILASAMRTVAMGSLWLGLRRSRRGADKPRSRLIMMALWIFGVLIVLPSASIALSNLRQSADSTQQLIVTITFATTVAHFAALTALTAISVAGARSGERPNRGWWLAAGSGLIVLVGNWTTPIAAFVLKDRFEANLVVVLSQGMSVASILLLLAAFALGLPADDRAEPHQLA